MSFRGAGGLFCNLGESQAASSLYAKLNPKPLYILMHESGISRLH